MDMDKQKILNYSTKDELQDILEEHGMPFSSPKPKLIENIIQNENIFQKALKNILKQLVKSELVEICGDLELPTTYKANQLRKDIKKYFENSNDGSKSVLLKNSNTFDAKNDQNKKKNEKFQELFTYSKSQKKNLDKLNIELKPGNLKDFDIVVTYHKKKIKLVELAELITLICRIEDMKYPKPKYSGSDKTINFLNDVIRNGIITEDILKKHGLKV